MECPVCNKEKKPDDFWIRHYGKCYNCKEAEDDLLIGEIAKRDGYCHYEKKIFCPHCGVVVEDYEVHESEENYECPYCEKKFDIQVEYAASYSTDKTPKSLDCKRRNENG